jgi:hypothetical protein
MAAAYVQGDVVLSVAGVCMTPKCPLISHFRKEYTQAQSCLASSPKRLMRKIGYFVFLQDLCECA